VTTHGTDKIAGLNFVGASIKAFPEFAGNNLNNAPGMMSDDLATNIAATRAFVRGCFEKQPTAEDFEIMLAFNMMLPAKVRANLFGRPLDATEVMSRLKIPVLVTHGDRDGNARLGTAQYTAKTIPGAKLSVYEGIGHAPFYEDAARFNTELAALVRSANRTN
jgi:pimeloyl-ACP methyl ester carboxylesterase